MLPLRGASGDGAAHRGASGDRAGQAVSHRVGVTLGIFTGDDDPVGLVLVTHRVPPTQSQVVRRVCSPATLCGEDRASCPHSVDSDRRYRSGYLIAAGDNPARPPHHRRQTHCEAIRCPKRYLAREIYQILTAPPQAESSALNRQRRDIHRDLTSIGALAPSKSAHAAP
jgi:hypothetical protein